jgi:hypothetical protein
VRVGVKTAMVPPHGSGPVGTRPERKELGVAEEDKVMAICMSRGGGEVSWVIDDATGVDDLTLNLD